MLLALLLGARTLLGTSASLVVTSAILRTERSDATYGAPGRREQLREQLRTERTVPTNPQRSDRTNLWSGTKRSCSTGVQPLKGHGKGFPWSVHPEQERSY